MNIKKLLRSFKFAGEGLGAVFKSEQNFRIELLISGIVFFLLFLFPLSLLETIIVILTVANMLTMEILNTVLEYLLDMNNKEKSREVKFLKDAMAAAVLINALVALSVWVFIFGSYLFK